MDIERVLEKAKGMSVDDQLGMILSNRIDCGSEAGGLISSNQFHTLIEDLKKWQAAGLALKPLKILAIAETTETGVDDMERHIFTDDDLMEFFSELTKSQLTMSV